MLAPEFIDEAHAMRATETLSEDHRLIERVFGALQVAAARLADGEAVAPSLFVDAARFIREFADGCHHRNEEEVLFPALVRHGFPLEQGPVAVMLHEHEQGRAHAAALREAADRFAAGDRSAIPAIVDAAYAYAGLLRAHIAKEDQILFRMAERAIPQDEHDAIFDAFESVARERPNPQPRAAYEALATRLEATLGLVTA